MLLRRACLAGSLTWVTALPLAAFVASRPAASSSADAFALSIYAAGRIVCHQLPARSFHLWGAALPVCARCTGIYLGAAAAALAIALGASSSVRTRTAKDVRLLLLLACVPAAVTLVVEWSTGVAPSNWIRAISGVPLGAAVAWAIGMVN